MAEGVKVNRETGSSCSCDLRDNMGMKVTKSISG
jgi:hypothetical protein